MQPLVSIICLCYNHEQFLLEALESVLNQTYKNLEIIVIDDASQDKSAALLQEYCASWPEIKLILHQQNTGNCRAFNEAFKISTGAFIIDFATDDVMLPNRIENQVNAFLKLDNTYGAIYTDAQLIDKAGNFIKNFYKRDLGGNLLDKTPTGYIFQSILKKSFICPPTVMLRRNLLTALGGYDESLAYEDFDLWVRSSLQFKYFYLDQVLTQRRVHAQSLSQQQYKIHDQQLASTIKVCQKARQFIRTPADQVALVFRIKAELRQAFFSENFKEAQALTNLLAEMVPVTGVYKIIAVFTRYKVKLGFIRKYYYQYKYKINMA